MYLLAHTRNQAAVPVLFAALASKRQEIRLGAIHGLVVRRNREGHVQVLHQFPTFGERELAVLTESLLHSIHRMEPSLRDAVLAEHLDLCESACHVAVLGHVYQLLPTLIEVAENRKHRHSARAAATIVHLANLLHQESLARPQDKTCDPALVRRNLLPSLEQSINRFGAHQRLEVVDAFLLVVPSSNPTLLKILGDAEHPCYRPIIDSLKTSALTPILELLTQLVHDLKVPASVLEIIANRKDRKFLDYLLHNIGTPVALRVLENVRRLNRLFWLDDARDALLELDGKAQAIAVELAVCGILSRNGLLALLRLLLERGQPEGRRAACDALAGFQDRQIDQLVLKTLDDADPRVQAAAARQLRQRRLPNAMERLVTLLDNPAPEVRDAARSSLAEFNFFRFRSAFEIMDERTRRRVGPLVRKVDPSSTARLIDLLDSPSMTTRLRGLEMTIAMEASDDVFGLLVQLLRDPDLGVRTEAVTALGKCHKPEALLMLRNAARDPILSVREAAKKMHRTVRQTRHIR
jgi:HEAT repeat protein